MIYLFKGSGDPDFSPVFTGTNFTISGLAKTQFPHPTCDNSDTSLTCATG